MNLIFNCDTWYSCKDDQTSADSKEAGKATGAMSYAFTCKFLSFDFLFFGLEKNNLFY
jgi:hypothetical protein